MQRIDFGTIEDLVVREGQPVLRPKPRVIRDVKFGARNDKRPQTGLSDFALKSSVQELMAKFDSLGEATVHRLVVKHGLPFSMQVEEFDA